MLSASKKKSMQKRVFSTTVEEHEDKIEEYKATNPPFPTLEAFAIHCGVSANTLTYFIYSNPEFKELHNKLKTWMIARWIENTADSTQYKTPPVLTMWAVENWTRTMDDPFDGTYKSVMKSKHDISIKGLIGIAPLPIEDIQLYKEMATKLLKENKVIEYNEEIQEGEIDEKVPRSNPKSKNRSKKV